MFAVGDRVLIVRINYPGVNPARDAFVGRTGTVRSIIKSRGKIQVFVPELGMWEADAANLQKVQ